MRVHFDESVTARIREAVGPRGATRFVTEAVVAALDDKERGDAELVLLPGLADPSPVGSGSPVFGAEGGNVLVGPPPVDGEVGVATPVRDKVWETLATNGQQESWLGALALRQAYIIDTKTSMQGYAVLVKELRATMGQALGDLPAEEDELTRLLKGGDPA